MTTSGIQGGGVRGGRASSDGGWIGEAMLRAVCWFRKMELGVINGISTHPKLELPFPSL